MSGYDFDPHEIAGLFESGVRAAELAVEFKCSKRTIYNVLHRAGVDLKPAGPASKRPSAETLKTLYITKAYTGKRIAQLFKVDPSTVTRWLAAYNIRKPLHMRHAKRAAKAKPGARNALARHRAEKR